MQVFIRRSKCLIVLSALGILASCAQVPPTDNRDVLTLKAAFEGARASIRSRDLDRLMDFTHDDIVAISPFAADGKRTYQWLWQTLLENTESISLVPVDTRYRVIGDTGLVWGHGDLAIRAKNASIQKFPGRFTIGFARTGGKWQAVIIHAQRIPAAEARDER